MGQQATTAQGRRQPHGASTHAIEGDVSSMRPPRRAVLAGLLGSLLAMPAARAEDYPSRPIKVVIPFSPGGPIDLLGRPLADKLSEVLGQPVVVDNRSGANGIIGTASVASSPPDGYTMLLTTGSFTGNAVVSSKIPYDVLKDFAPITQVAQSYGIVLMLRPSLPALILPELVALAKQSPGKYSYAHAGIGNLTHVAGELFQKVAGIELLKVPYRGAGAFIADIIAGQVDMGFTSTVASTPNVKAGLVRGVAITGPRRAPSLPDVPSFQEFGYRDMDLTGYHGLWFPPGTPRERVERVQRAVVKVLDTPEMKRVIVDSGIEAVGSTPEAFARFIEQDLALQKSIMQRIGLQPQ